MNNGAPRLIFPPGANAGFSSVSLSISSDKESPGIVREILQNSLDAAKDAGQECAKVNFSLENVPIKDIPGIGDYRKAVEGCVEFCKQRGWPSQERQVVENLKGSLKKKKLPVLFITDNGVGFNRKTMTAILSDGINSKESEGSSGSHGNGHFTVFNLSWLRYLLYGGVSASGKMVAGQSILCSHQGDDGRCGSNGYFISRMNDDDVLYPYEFVSDERLIPPLMMDKLRQIESKHGSGALLAVLDFNYFGEDDVSGAHAADLILGAAARNFFVAIHRGNLEIAVQIGKTKRQLTAKNLAEVMKNVAPKIGNARNFPRQNTAQRFYELFSDCEQGVAKAKIDNAETESGSLKIYYRQGQVNATSIAFCRNGMWITKSIPHVQPSHFAEYAPFEALILCDATADNADLSKLIRDAESNLHNAIITKLVQDDRERANLKNALTATRNKLQELIDKQDSETLNFIEVECVGKMDDAPGRRAPKTGGTIIPIVPPLPGATTQAEEGGAPTHPNPAPDNPIIPPGPGPKPRPGQALRVNCVAVRSGNKMRIRIVTLAASPDVELRFALNGGRDLSCDSPDAEKPKVNLKSVKCNNEDCAVADGTARIGEVAAGEEKIIEAEFERPKIKDGNYKVDCEFIRRAVVL